MAEKPYFPLSVRQNRDIIMLDKMERALSDLQDTDVSFSEIRNEVRTSTRIYVTNASLRDFSRRGKAGTVARVLVGECWGQATSTDEVTSSLLKELLETATRMAKHNASHSRKKIDLSEVKAIQKQVFQKMKEDPESVSDEEKAKIVFEIDKAQEIDERVVNTNSVYQDTKKHTLLANSEGTRLEWDEIRTYVIAQSVAKEGTNTQFDYEVKDSLSGFELVRNLDPSEFGAKCAEGAVNLLSAEKPPSGEMTVVVDGNIAGLIAHEVCGHASEADEVVKGRSFLTDKVGVKLAAEGVFLVDDGTLDGLVGSFPFDSEGTRSSRTSIIENGVYSGYLHTLETSAIMGVKPTGNGRAEDYNRRIYARMTNTFFDKGDWTKSEIIEDTKNGLYLIKGTSGMEDVVGGGVQATCLKGYIIKNGEIGQLLRGMSITGQVLEILKTVDAVGDTLEFSGGTCGKGEEDFVPVTSGGPHMRVRIVVGGG